MGETRLQEDERLAQYPDPDRSDSSARKFGNQEWFTFAVGAVVVSASQMETALAGLYAALLKSDVGLVIAHGQPFDTVRVACVSAVAELDRQARLPSALAEDVRHHVGRAKELYDRRNQVAHGLWVIDDLHINEPRLVVRFRKNGKPPDEARWTQFGLMQLADNLVDTGRELQRVALDVMTARLA